MGFGSSIGKFIDDVTGGNADVLSTALSIAAIFYPWLLIPAIVVGYTSGAYQAKLARDAMNRMQSSATGHLVNTMSSKETVPIAYGRCRIGGNRIFAETGGASNKYLWTAVTLCEGPIEGVETIYLNDSPALRWRKLRDDGPDSTLKWWQKLIYALASHYDYEIDDDVDAVEITLELSFVASVEDKYSTRDTTLRDTKTWTVSRGETVDLTFSVNESENYEGPDDDWRTRTTTGTFNGAATFDAATGHLEIDTELGSKISSVSFPRMQVAGEWIADKSDLYEFAWCDGAGQWYRRDETTAQWVADNSLANTVRHEMLDRGFVEPTGVAFVAARLTYEAGYWQGVPTITALGRWAKRTNPYKGTSELIDNPVLALRDYLTSTTYGLGLDAARLDYYGWGAAYLDTKSAGITFNGVILGGRASENIEMLLRHVRGVLVYQEGVYHIRVMDTQTESIYPTTITDEDMTTDGLRLSVGDVADIPNTARVSFIDADMNYKVNTTEIRAAGTESEDERLLEIELWGLDAEYARRLAAYHIERARLTTSVSFTVTHQFLDLTVGRPFRLSYPDWGISEQLFRATGITVSPTGTMTINALIEDDALYDGDATLSDYDLDISSLAGPTDPVDAPEVASATEELIKTQDGRLQTNLTIEWSDAGVFVDYYLVWINDGSGWRNVGITRSLVHVATGLKDATTYAVRIGVMSTAGIETVGETTNVYVYGRTALPANVSGAKYMLDGDRLIIAWTPVADADVSYYEVRRGGGFEYGAAVAKTPQSSIAVTRPMPGNYTYWVKAVDTSGNRSESATQVAVYVPDDVSKNVVANHAYVADGYDPSGIPGSGMWLIPEMPGYTSLHMLTDQDVSGRDDTDSVLSSYEGDMTYGFVLAPIGLPRQYTYAVLTPQIDIGKLVRSTVRLDVDIDITDPAITDMTYPERTDKTFPKDTDQSVTPDYRMDVTMYYSDDASTWESVNNPENGDYLFRHVYFQVQIITPSRTARIVINEISVQIDVPDVIITLTDFAVSASGETINYAAYGADYLQTPNVSVTPQGGSLRTPAVTKNGTIGFDVALLDINENQVSGTADITVRGF